MNNIFERKSFKKAFLSLLMLTFVLSAFRQQEKPTLYIIGDSTVRNSRGDGGPGDWGWGTFIDEHFDTTRINVSNQAMAGRSTRTFLKEGRWERVLSSLKPGDFVMMQFGHNEGSPPDTTRAGYRGVLKGTGEETKELLWPDGTKETVHSYGWYLNKFIEETKSKGATPVVISMIPRNRWKDGKKVERADKDYGKWAKEAAKKGGAYFIDLNKILADKYEKMGSEVVKDFFPNDHTHTDEAGARLNAASVVEGVQDIKKLPLRKYLQGEEGGKPTLFLIGDSTVKNGQGDGAGGLWGWGNFLSAHFDTTKISIENRALGGTSSRTYRTKGLWKDVLKEMEEGDYVIMQFGHNDNIALTDTLRSRGTIKGVSKDSVEVYNPLTKQQEWVHSYGWYMEQFIKEAKEKGVIPIVASSVPQNKWDSGNFVPSFENYSKWAEAVANETQTYFIPLNQIISEGYIELGEEKVRSAFFNSKDRTHTIEEGAKYNAGTVAESLRSIGSPLKLYLRKYQEQEASNRK